MADNELSASDLRKRYMRGGTYTDDQLTSAQLRARHAIPSNSAGEKSNCIRVLLLVICCSASYICYIEYCCTILIEKIYD